MDKEPRETSPDGARQSPGEAGTREESLTGAHMCLREMPTRSSLPLAVVGGAWNGGGCEPSKNGLPAVVWVCVCALFWGQTGASVSFSKCIWVLPEAGCPGQGLGPVRPRSKNSDLVLGACLTPGWDLGGGVGSYLETARNIPPTPVPPCPPRGGLTEQRFWGRGSDLADNTSEPGLFPGRKVELRPKIL